MSTLLPNPAAKHGLIETVLNVIHQKDGPLTRELLLTPGRFGLGQVPASRLPTATTRLTCGFCSTGCSLDVHLQDGQAVGLSPSTDYPVNLGMACPKGWEALTVLQADDRATVPLLKRNGAFQEIGWPEAVRALVDRIRHLQEKHGPQAVAFLGTGQMPVEELAFFGTLCRFGLGMLHGDANTRQCMATAAVAYKQSFGFDAPPLSYTDFEESDCLIFIGANPCIAHPILWERVMRNRKSPEIVVVDPRCTETAMQATWHLPLAPKSDLPLFDGVARELIVRDWIDERYIADHTTGFDGFRRIVEPFTPERVAEETGLPKDAVVRLATLIHSKTAVSFWWTMGVNQSYQGVRTAQALINLALMTGHIGRPGTGPNSITGQCNAMGSRIFGNTSNLLGGRDFARPEHRRDVARLLGIDDSRIQPQVGYTYPQILDAVKRGEIKGLWIAGTNPGHSWIERKEFDALRERLDFLCVQDMYRTTESARAADLLLPAAGWGEKDGTFINSERRFGVIKKVSRAPGQALSDFAIFQAVAHAAGQGEMFREWTSPEAVFQILKRLSAGRPCDITGIRDYRHLDESGGLQWPYPANSVPTSNARRLFEDGQFFHDDSRAKFLADPPRPLPEAPDADYPFILLTGRGNVAQWHTQTRTAKSAVLRKLAPKGLHLEIHPDDARRRGINDAETVLITSRRATITARAFVTATVQPGQVFLPMHDATVNLLTRSEFDPHSHQPNYKDCAVAVTASAKVPTRPSFH